MLGWVDTISSWFWGLGKFRRAGVLLVYLLLLGSAGGVMALSDNTQHAAGADSGQINTAQATLADAIEKRVEMKFGEEMPFQKKKVEDPTLAEGESYIRVQGIKGKRDVTYGVIYTNGEETSRRVLEEKIIKKPVDEVTVVGTMSAEGTGPQVQGTQTQKKKTTSTPSEPNPEPAQQDIIKKVSVGRYYYCLTPDSYWYDTDMAYTPYPTLEACQATLPHAND